MKIKIVASGKLKKGPLYQIIQDYLKRCQWKIEIIEVDPKKSILPYLSKDETTIILDEKGESLTSQEFSQRLEGFQNKGVSSLTFVIGAAEGLDAEVKGLASHSLSFGRATWPHMIVRMMLVEQLYRAEQILKGHPYHKD